MWRIISDREVRNQGQWCWKQVSAPQGNVSVWAKNFFTFSLIYDPHSRQDCQRSFSWQRWILYTVIIECKRGEGVEPGKLSFSNQLSKDWCNECQVSIKISNKGFFMTASARKERITDFLKNIWTVRYTFSKLYRVDLEIVMSNQMPLHRNESSNEKALNFKGAPQTTYVKENHSLSRERITAMTSIASGRSFSTPELEFVFKGTGKRVKLNSPSGVTIQWTPKGFYRPDHVVKSCDQVPAQPCAIFLQKQNIHIGWLLGTFRSSSQRIIEQKRLFFGDFAWRYDRGLAG